MTIILGPRSRAMLKCVHPDLIRVIERAAALAEASEDFTVIEGVRSAEQMCINYGKGRTARQCLAKGVPAHFSAPGARQVTWLAQPLQSNHAVKADGFAHAVDIAPFPIDWKDVRRFDNLAGLVKQAAKIEAVGIGWGGDWTRPDRPHFELKP